jgi:DNA-binding MarR family transcriptional regulator
MLTINKTNLYLLPVRMNTPKKDIYKNMPLGKLCTMITRPYFGVLSRRMEPLGIEKNFSVLILLEEQKHCTQQYISDTLQIDKVSMVKIIDGFSKQGFVNRVQNPRDRREYFIELTPKGLKILPQIHKAIGELNDIAFKGFKPGERKLFMDMLIRTYHNVEHIPSSHVIVYKTKKLKDEK